MNMNNTKRVSNKNHNLNGAVGLDQLEQVVFQRHKVDQPHLWLGRRGASTYASGDAGACS